MKDTTPKPKLTKGKTYVVRDARSGHFFKIGEEVTTKRWDTNFGGNWKCVNGEGKIGYLMESDLREKS